MHRPTRRIAIVLALLAAVALLGPTAATQFLPMLPADDIGNQVHLQPSSGPTGSYAYLEDGDIVIDVSPSNPAGDVEGVDADSVTRIDDVFVVHYAGSEYADVWLTHEGEGLTFIAADRPIESHENAITLGPNETVAVGLMVDTTDGNAIESVDEFTVHARAGEPESESSSEQSDDDGTDGWSSGAASSPTEPDGDGDGDETSVSPSTTTNDSSSAESTVAPADDPETAGADPTADETTVERTTQRTTAQDDDSPMRTLFGDRAGLGPRSAMGMAIVALLAALAVAVVLGGRRGS